jgi:hypothetical protein
MLEIPCNKYGGKKLLTKWEKMGKSGIKWEVLYYFYLPNVKSSDRNLYR